MDVDFSSIADDFFVNVNLQTALPLSNNRETILHFSEAVQKEFQNMTMFYERESGEYVLEGDRESGSYQWMELHPKRLAAGAFNPPDLASAYRLHQWLLDRSVYHLGISGLDVECLDIMFGFNLEYVGNRDEIVAQALLVGSPLAALIADVGVGCIECEPNLVVSLEENGYRQLRLSLETRGSSYQFRTRQFDHEPISAYLTVRQYPQPGEIFDTKKCFTELCGIVEDLTCRLMIPQVIRPVSDAIAAAQ